MLAVIGESFYSLFGSIVFGVTAVEESDGVLHRQVVHRCNVERFHGTPFCVLGIVTPCVSQGVISRNLRLNENSGTTDLCRFAVCVVTISLQTHEIRLRMPLASLASVFYGYRTPCRFLSFRYVDRLPESSLGF